MMLSKSQCLFLELVSAGQWVDADVNLDFNDNLNNKVDWEEMYRLAQEQSVQGLVLQGIEAVQDSWLRVHGSPLVPQMLLLQWIGELQMIEQRNKAMNEFVAKLLELLRKKDIHALLVKGQGIAQCYERPLWRSCGDVDFLLDIENYEKGKRFLSGIAQKVHKENDFDKHFSVILNGWDVELHGSMRSMLPKKTDDLIDRVQEDAFKTGRCRVWSNNGTDILLPCPDDDVIFVFSHILKHFFHYGIGLRQVCDWSRLLYAYHDAYDLNLLEKRLNDMKLMTEWKVFGSLAVNRLGMPYEFMPFYSNNKSYQHKADRVLKFIFETGNFGHNRDNSYYNKSNAIVRGAMSLWQHTCDSITHSFIFPADSIKIWGRMLVHGISDTLKGK